MQKIRIFFALKIENDMSPIQCQEALRRTARTPPALSSFGGDDQIENRCREILAQQ
ncbi:MAG: hypothetical protein FWG62_07075 [Proteobacteria bacterium]|nr:hypothetical protein [Pseudomonadota bacterium]